MEIFMKKIIVLIVSLCLLTNLVGCAKVEKELTTPDYSVTPFCEDENLYDLTDEQIESIIPKIPSDQYEVYPSMQNVPLSATLYKNGEVISIDIRDPRLIRLINFFNNSLFYEKCAYSLSHLDQDDLEDIMSEEFRLELKYEPYGEKVPTAYENQPTLFDTIVVHGGSFALINNDFPWYYVDELIPFKGNHYSPYGIRQPSGWLELFGF